MEEPAPDPVERAIRRAQAEGAFEDLPGAGRPIPGLDRPYDPAWWARNWAERERADGVVRELAARLRREVSGAVSLPDRGEARERLEALNAEIDRANEQTSGELVLEPLDVEALLRRFPD